MQGFNDFIFVVAGEDESAVATKLLNRRPKEGLYVMGCVICLINDDDLCLAVDENETVEANCFALFRTVSRNRPSSDPLMT